MKRKWFKKNKGPDIPSIFMPFDEEEEIDCLPVEDENEIAGHNFSIAYYQYMLGDIDESILSIAKGLEITCESYEKWVLFADILHGRGVLDCGLSIQCCERLISLDPDELIPRILLALLLIRGNRHKQAIDELERCLDYIDGGNPKEYESHEVFLSVVLLLGDEHRDHGDIEEAVRYFEILTKMQPDIPTNHHKFGCVLLEQEDYNRAIEQFNRVVDLDPKNEDAYLGIVIAYEHIGRRKDAIAAFYNCLRYADPDRVAMIEDVKDCIGLLKEAG